MTQVASQAWRTRPKRVRRSVRLTKRRFGCTSALIFALSLTAQTGGVVDVSPAWSLFLNASGQKLSEGAGVRLRLRQPLLRGGGLNVDTAPVRLARIAEASHVLGFEGATMDVATAVIFGYRAVIEAERRMAIEQRALDRTRAMLSVNRALMDRTVGATLDTWDIDIEAMQE